MLTSRLKTVTNTVKRRRCSMLWLEIDGSCRPVRGGGGHDAYFGFWGGAFGKVLWELWHRTGIDSYYFGMKMHGIHLCEFGIKNKYLGLFG